MLIAYAQQATAAAAEAAHGATEAFPPFDASLFPGQLFWFVITFGALYVLMAYVALPKVGAVIATREGTLKSDRDGAAEKTSAAEDARAQMEKAIAKARADARALIDDMRAKTQAELNAEQAAAEARVAQRVAEAEAKIDTARQKALGDVDGVARALAEQVVEKLAPAPEQENEPEPLRMAEGESR